MAAMSDYCEQQLIKHLFRTGSFTKPTVIAIGLYTAAPSDAGGGTEVTGGAYARQTLNPLDANWTDPTTTGTTDNASAITFPTATANWGTITHVGIFDAASAGNLLFWGALTQSKVVNSGDTFSFAIGALDVQIDN
jgi:hypothetical protein